MTESFWNNLSHCNLLTSDQLQSTQQHFADADDSKDATVTAWLVDRNWLTAWQREMLLAGHRRFFLGRYRLMSLLGQGGMGAVFRAEQAPLGRTVAIKVLSRNMIGDAEAVARFRREIEAAAALVHPNIVTAYDADCVQGSHFLVMDFVDGRDLSSLLKEYGRLPVGEACEYVRQAALGLQHAFEQDMVHRDIKPGNLLVHHSPGQPPVVKVLDLGLARFTSETSEAGHLTQAGQVMGTPDYIAPEQSVDTHSADIRADIFSLGCTLFRLLTGQLPWPDGSPVKKLIARRMTDAPPLREIDSSIPTGLESVVARMLERDPADRFQTPVEVAQALAPFANASPVGTSKGHGKTPVQDAAANISATRLLPDDVVQGDASTVGLMAALTTEASVVTGHDVSTTQPRREVLNPPPVVTTPTESLRDKLDQKRADDRKRVRIGGAVVVLLVGIVLGWLQWNAARRTHFVVAWGEAERQGVTVEVDGQVRTFGTTGQTTFSGDAGPRTLRLTRRDYFPIEVEITLEAGQSHTVRPDWKPKPSLVRRNQFSSLQQQVKVLLKADAPDSELTAMRRLVSDFRTDWAGSSETRRAATLLRQLPAYADSLSRDDGLAPEQFSAAHTGEALHELVAVIGDSRLRHAGHIRDLAFTRDSAQLVTVGNDNIVQCWDARSGELLRTILQNRETHDIEFSPDGSQLAIGALDLLLVDWPSGELQQSIKTNRNARRLTYAPDGGTVAFVDYSGFQLLDVGTAECTGARYLDAAFSPDGSRVVFVDQTHGYIVDRATGEQLHLFAFSNSHKSRVQWSQDGQLIAVTGSDQDGALLFDPDSGELLRSVSWDLDCRVEFHPDSKRLALTDVAGHGCLYDIESETVIEEWGNGVIVLAFSPDGETLATGTVYGEVQIRDGRTGKIRIEQPPVISSATISADGRHIATGHTDGSVRIIDLAAARVDSQVLNADVNPRVHHFAVWSLDFAPTGQQLASAGGDFLVRITDLVGGRSPMQSNRHGAHHVTCVCFNEDGQIVASAGNDETVRLWNLKDDREIGVFEVGLNHVVHLTVQPHGNLIGLAERNGHIQIWDVSKNVRVFERTAHAIAFSPDGREFAIGESDGNVGLWNAETLKHERYVVQHPQRVQAVAFSQDGQTLASASSDGLIRLATVDGDTVTRDPRMLQLASSFGGVRQVIFTPDARHLLTVNLNGTVGVLRLSERDGK